MKTNIKLFSLVLLLAIIFSCKKKQSCKIDYTNIIKTDTLIDYNASSTHYHQKVAVFKLTDNSTVHYDADLYSHCGERDECKISLTIKNITTQQISMDYKVLTNSVAGQLNYSSQVTVPAGGTVDIGQISDTCIYLSNSSYRAESTNITYF